MLGLALEAVQQVARSGAAAGLEWRGSIPAGTAAGTRAAGGSPVLARVQSDVLQHQRVGEYYLWLDAMRAHVRLEVALGGEGPAAERPLARARSCTTARGGTQRTGWGPSSRQGCRAACAACGALLDDVLLSGDKEGGNTLRTRARCPGGLGGEVLGLLVAHVLVRVLGVAVQVAVVVGRPSRCSAGWPGGGRVRLP